MTVVIGLGGFVECAAARAEGAEQEVRTWRDIRQPASYMVRQVPTMEEVRRARRKVLLVALEWLE